MLNTSFTKNTQTIINIFSSLIVFFSNILINFFLSPYIVLHLGEEVNGYIQLANNFTMYASLITIALNSMAARFISISYHKHEINSANKYYTSVIIGNIIILFILIILSFLCIINLEKILNISYTNINEIKILFIFVFMTFFITQITSIFNIAFFVTNTIYLSNLIGILRSILNVILLGLIFTFLTPKIYFVSLVSFLLSVIILLITFIFKVKILDNVKFYINNFSFKYIYEIISSGIWNTVNQCGNILMTGLDLLLANLLINPVDMGILSISKIIPNSIVQLASIVNNNFSPSMVITFSTGKKEDLLKELRLSMKVSSVLVSVPIMIFCIFGKDFYELWMPTVDAKILTILSILTCMPFIPFSGPQVLYNVYTVTNKLALNSITVIIGGILNFIFVMILIKYTQLGIFAIAGVSSIISILRNMIITVPYTAKLLNLKWYIFYKDVIISVMCCFLTFLASTIIKAIIIPNGWFMLIVSVIFSTICSFITNILFVLNKQEKINIKNKVLKGMVKIG